MATGATSDLVPVRKDTKGRLAALKGDATYDRLLQVLLDLASPEAVESALRGPSAPPEAKPRPPEKQLLIANLAATRWRRWIAEGRVIPRGPRLYTWNVKPATKRSVRYEYPRRRGFSP